MIKMVYPQTTPTVFGGAKKFVEEYGATVWGELCDTVKSDQWFDVSATAQQLNFLKQYRTPERYLRAVLKAVIADYAERPDAYENRPPVQLHGRSMIKAKI